MKYSIRKRNNLKKGRNPLPGLFLALSFLILLPATGRAASGDKESEDSGSKTELNARKVFERLHSSALEILPVSTRLDMLDYWDVDSVYKAINVMGGFSWIEKMTDNYLKVQISPVSTLEIKLLPVKKGEIVLTVYTVGDSIQAADSQLKFYDETLTELPADKYFKNPEIKDFFAIPRGSSTTMKEIEQMIPFPTIEYSSSAENDNLTAKLTVEKYVNEDDWNIAKLFLKPDVVFEWKKDKFTLVK